MSGSYSLPLVGLSILLATALSFVALWMAGARSHQYRETSAAWAAATALVLGTGIWSMHFVGMLAFHLPMPVGFDFTTTLASWAAAVLVCWLGLTFVIAPSPSQASLLFGAMLMGAGIAVMHYSGMSAMQMTPSIRYIAMPAALSVVIGVAASYAALRLVIQLRSAQSVSLAKRVGAACLMGLAASGLHYTAMAAAVFAPDCVSRAAADFDQRSFIFEIFIAVVAVLGVALLAILLQTRREAKLRDQEQSLKLSATTNELMASEERFKAAQEVAVDPFLVLKAIRTGTTVVDFAFEYANPAALRFFGATGQEIVGRRFLDRFPTALANGIFATYARVLMDGQATTVEQQYCGDGFSCWVRINCVKLFDGVAITFTDITERKALENLAASMLDEQSKARELAEQKNVAKDAFIAAVSHELRNPVTAVLSWVEILKRTAANLPSSTENVLARIEDSAKAQVRLVEDLLDASVVSAGKIRLAMAPVQLLDLVETTVVDAAMVAAKRDVHIRFDPAQACAVVGDEHRLRQVLANVLQNAVKFSNPGGTVTTRLVCRGDSAIIEVADSGIGITATALPHIFERFTQEETTDPRRVRGGVGLGLAICKQLVEAHSGKIEAFSDGPGTGTMMRISLPVSPVALPETAESTQYF